MIGKTISHYKIIEKLGEGGMGEVYLADDLKLERHVAIKFLSQHLTQNKKNVKRFEREAKAAASLNHPNIITIHEIAEENDQIFIVMEYVEGKSLRDIINTNSEFPIPNYINIIAQICEGLSQAHKANIVHRDIKPENIMIDKNTRVKILDFGLAKLKGVSKLTKDTKMLGTINYMSPEQIRGEEIDQRSDIWSLGVVLFELFSGILPFRGEYDQVVMYSILNEEPKLLIRSGIDIPMELKQLVHKCLNKNPYDRYQEVTELFVIIESVCKNFALSRKVSKSGLIYKSFVQRKKLVLYSFFGVLFILFIIISFDLFIIPKDTIDSIAVLPLKNLMNDPNLNYFVDGMTEALIANLAKVSAIRVISHQSVMQYRNSSKSLPQIGKELDVDALIEGSVFRSGNRVRIRTNLIRAIPEQHLWVESYERDLKDIFALQSQLAKAIVEEIKIAVTPDEESRLIKVNSVNFNAYESYLKGRYYLNKRTKDGFEKAIEYFKESIRQDSDYPMSYVGLADAYTLLADYGYLDPKYTYPKAKEAAMQALKMEETISEAHASLAYVKSAFDWAWIESEIEFKRAIELNPSNAMAHHWYAIYLIAMERHKDALKSIKRARELDPFSLIINTNVGWINYFVGNYDEAINEYKKVLKMDPKFVTAYYKMGYVYAQKGMYDEALKSSQMVLKILGWDWSSQLGYIYAKAGYRDKALQILHKMILESKSRHVIFSDIAATYNALGEIEKAFLWLEIAIENRDTWLRYLQVDPSFNSLHSDPRFDVLLRKIKLKNDG